MGTWSSFGKKCLSNIGSHIPHSHLIPGMLVISSISVQSCIPTPHHMQCISGLFSSSTLYHFWHLLQYCGILLFIYFISFSLKPSMFIFPSFSSSLVLGVMCLTWL